MSASRGEHAHAPPGTIVENRYQIIRELGFGNFSKAYVARDLNLPSDDPESIVALKILKKEYAHDAKFEHDILKTVTREDPEKKQKVLREKAHFIWNNRYPCFVLERKGSSIRSCKLGIQNGTYTRNDFKRFCCEMLKALEFLHFKIQLVHTDLKPDNILLDIDPVKDNSSSSSTSTQTCGLGNGWTIIDFGSASFYRMDRMDSDLISTRPYRAPEVILGNPWYWPADIWSMGCIFYEVYTGKKLFDVNDDYVHLAFIEAKLNPFQQCPARGVSIMPPSLSLKSKNCRRFYSSNGTLLRPLNSKAATLIKPLSYELRHDPLFLDFITQMLQMEPSKRLRSDDALKQPFLTAEPISRGAPIYNDKKEHDLNNADSFSQLEGEIDKMHISSSTPVTSSDHNGDSGSNNDGLKEMHVDAAGNTRPGHYVNNKWLRAGNRLAYNGQNGGSARSPDENSERVSEVPTFYSGSSGKSGLDLRGKNGSQKTIKSTVLDKVDGDLL